MPRPKGSSPRSYELIFNAIYQGPKCYSDIITETELHRNTVSDRLRYLVEKGLVVKHRIGERVFYELPSELTSNLEWIGKWAEICTIKDANYIYKWAEKHMDFVCKLNIDRLVEIANKVTEELLLKRYSLDISKIESQELLLIAHELNIPITLEELLTNLDTPYCKECLKNKRIKIPTTYIKDTREFVCPKCGLVNTLA